MGKMRGAMEKLFVFFAILALGCIPLAVMGMVSGMVMFGLLALTASAGVCMVITHPSERKQ